MTCSIYITTTRCAVVKFEAPVVMSLATMHSAFRASCSTDLFSILANVSTV